MFRLMLNQQSNKEELDDVSSYELLLPHNSEIQSFDVSNPDRFLSGSLKMNFY